MPGDGFPGTRLSYRYSSAYPDTQVSAPYVARQGTALGRSGRVHIFREADGQIWVGGGALTCVSGFAEL